MNEISRWIARAFGGPDVLELSRPARTAPGSRQVVIDVEAVGMNPADYKHIAPGQDPTLLPLTIGFEVAGIVAEVGAGVARAGSFAVGDKVLAGLIADGYSSRVTVDVEDVFLRPDALTPAQAANLLLVGTTAAELLFRSAVTGSDTVLLHGASGAVGLSVLQQAVRSGATVIGTSGPAGFDSVRRFGGIPVLYGPGLRDRVAAAAPGGVTVALDTAGTDEAIDVSLELVPDRARIVTIAAFARAASDGLLSLGRANPDSGPFRARARATVVELAANGALTVPIARTFPFAAAVEALALIQSGRAGGKVALMLDPPTDSPETSTEEHA